MSFFVYGGSVKNTIQVFETKSKYNNAHPNFNEEFVLQTTGDWKKIDIQISIKVITPYAYAYASKIGYAI